MMRKSPAKEEKIKSRWPLSDHQRKLSSQRIKPTHLCENSFNCIFHELTFGSLMFLKFDWFPILAQLCEKELKILSWDAWLFYDDVVLVTIVQCMDGLIVLAGRLSPLTQWSVETQTVTGAVNNSGVFVCFWRHWHHVWTGGTTTKLKLESNWMLIFVPTGGLSSHI